MCEYWIEYVCYNVVVLIYMYVFCILSLVYNKAIYNDLSYMNTLIESNINFVGFCVHFLHMGGTGANF